MKINFSIYFGIILLYVKLFFPNSVTTIANVDITINQILLLIIFFRFIKNIFLFKRMLIWDEKSQFFFWFYILISSIISLLLSPEISIGVITVNFQLFLVYLIFVEFKSLNLNYCDINKVINLLVNFALLNTFLVFYTFFFGKIGLLGEVYDNESITRAFGLMGDQLPWFLSFFAIYSLYLGKKFYFILFSTAILMTASLGATIVSVISLFVYLLRNKKMNIFFYAKLGFAILTILILPLKFNSIGIIERINSGDFNNVDSGTSGHRFSAITHAIERIKEKPFLGYQNFSLSMFNKYDHLLSDNEKWNLSILTTPNNQVLAIICDYGFVGLFLFIFFIHGLIKIVRKRNKILEPNLYAFKESTFIWFVVFIFFNQSATWFLPGSFLWILICLIIGISYAINKLYEVK